MSVPVLVAVPSMIIATRLAPGMVYILYYLYHIMILGPRTAPYVPMYWSHRRAMNHHIHIRLCGEQQCERGRTLLVAVTMVA